MTFLLRFWKPLAALFAGLLALFGARQAGSNTVKRKAAEKALKDAQAAKEIDSNVDQIDDSDIDDHLAPWMRDDDTSK